jgi:hypothetical protein
MSRAAARLLLQWRSNSGETCYDLVLYMDGALLTQDELRQAVAEVFKRSQTDADFRRLCIEDPGEAIYQVCGKRMPAEWKVTFVEPPDSDNI